MPTLITNGGTTIAPTLLIGLTEAAPGGTVVHPIIGRSEPDVTLRPAGLRTGRLELVFTGTGHETRSAAALTALRVAAVFTLSDTDRTTYNMRFVVPEGGEVSRELDDVTRDAYFVRVDYQEVTA